MNTVDVSQARALINAELCVSHQTTSVFCGHKHKRHESIVQKMRRATEKRTNGVLSGISQLPSGS